MIKRDLEDVRSHETGFLCVLFFCVLSFLQPLTPVNHVFFLNRGMEKLALHRIGSRLTRGGLRKARRLEVLNRQQEVQQNGASTQVQRPTLRTDNT